MSAAENKRTLVDSKEEKFYKDIDCYKREFEDCKGLKVGNNVWFSGVKVGIVKDISFESIKYVKVVMSIEAKSSEFIRKDAVAKLGSDGLIGNSIITLVGGSQTAQPIADGDILHSAKGTDMEAMMATLSITDKDVIYEDNHLIAINKRAGDIVQVDDSGDKSLDMMVKEYLERKYEKPNAFIGVIHRLDRPVSGLIVLRRRSKGLDRMNKLFHDRDVEKSYLAVVRNKPEQMSAKNCRTGVLWDNGKKFWISGFKEWGGKIQNDITDGVMLLIHEGIADRNKIAIMGNGFGGYSALYAACFNSSLYACAISNSGYTNLFTYFKQVPPYFKPYVQFYYQVVGNPETESDLFKAISPVFHSDKV
ncbi:hypothetical protein FQR65_LT14738 [Abscondita terminalis]|nr:hypothetical protein FQR65_LT14738 [Abscondita terminalis]